MKITMILSLMFMMSSYLYGQSMKIGDLAPLFSGITDKNEIFDLQTQKGKWTILYFYPKANTPGCTAQAIGFNSKIEELKKLNVDVVGISSDEVSDLIKFKKDHNLNLKFISDANTKISELYGTKYPLFSYSKRWSFIIDPSLKVRFIETDVNASEDANVLINEIKKLQSKPI